MAKEPTFTQIPKSVSTPAPVGNGYPVKVKTDGVKQRGSGAATKGFTSRGPLG